MEVKFEYNNGPDWPVLFHANSVRAWPVAVPIGTPRAFQHSVPENTRGDNVQREGHRNRWRRAAGCVPPGGYPCTNLTSIGTRNHQPPGWPTFSQLTFDKLINKSVFPILSHFPVLRRRTVAACCYGEHKTKREKPPTDLIKPSHCSPTKYQT